MSELAVNLSLWQQIQIEINANKVLKKNFKKTLQEKVEVANAKRKYKSLKQRYPSEHNQALGALLDIFSEMKTPDWGSLTFNKIKMD